MKKPLSILIVSFAIVFFTGCTRNDGDINNVTETETGEDIDIIRQNNGVEVLLKNLKYPYAYNVTPYEVWSVAFISDVHANTANLIRFKYFCDYYSSYIDVMLHGGDTVERSFNDESRNVDVVKNADIGEMLNCIGNHDVAFYNDGVFIWDYYKQSVDRRVEVYNKIIGQYVLSWNVIQPDNASNEGLCYYFKDFDNSKLRLIVIDSTECDSEMNNQIIWLDKVLNDTICAGSKANGYSVVICQHYVPCSREMFIPLVNPFTSVIPPIEFNYNKALIETVSSYIEKGGSFVCYLAGHNHQDYCGYFTINGKKQLVIDIATGGGYNSVARDYFVENDSINQDCFDVIGVDSVLKLLKIVRVGANTDLSLREKKTVCINYQTCDLVI